MDLAGFLLERFAEDADAARLCAEMFPGPWEIADRGWRVRIYAEPVPDLGEHADPGDLRVPIVMQVEPDRNLDDPHWLSERIEHVVRHEPSRVLREVEAKRRLVGLHSAWAAPLLSDPSHRTCSECEMSYPCPTLRVIVAVYREHPDYQPAWTPVL